MDKTILRNFAIYSRNKLIQDIKNKASMIGITEKGIKNPLSESTLDMLAFDIKAIETYKVYGKEVKQYRQLIEELKKRENNSDYKTAYNNLIEEVAYTWFNRLIALRFMEVNNYLPDKLRVLSSGREGVDEPEFLTHYEDTSLEFTDKELDLILNWKLDGSAPSMENIFHLLFIKQCNSLNDNLPELFEEIDDYAELLLNISYIDEEGVLYKLVHDIPESYFDIETENGNGQVEIIGWMYQYYNSERKDEVFSRPTSKKILKEDIPAATQIFTPDWIVRYMVENSLGRLWIEKLIVSGDTRSEKEISEEFNWKYYIPEAEQNSEIKEQLIQIRNDKKDIQLEDIKFIDPAMGSFHIGVYAFEIFMQLYESQGYTTREAARLIIENNLYGIDIDKRAYQLSYFACMMKGRQHNRIILNGEIKCNLYAISESNDIDRNHLDYFGNNIEDKKTWEKYKEETIEILEIFKDAKEYGSILIIENKYDFDALREFVIYKQPDLNFDTMGIDNTQNEILEMLNVAKMLSQKYDIVVTNPPYMGSRGMNSRLSKYLRDNFFDSKTDLFAVFMERCKEFATTNGYYSMITQHSWMFLSSYEKLREKLQSNTIQNMVHLGARAFEEIGGEVVQTTTFVFKNAKVNYHKGSYIRLVDFNNAVEKEVKTLEAIDNPKCGYYYETEQDNFEKIPGMPVAYNISGRALLNFNQKRFSDVATARAGMITGNNDVFIRLWHEVLVMDIKVDAKNREDASGSNRKWFPYSKGGSFKKWYGNNEYVVDWHNDGYNLKNTRDEKGNIPAHAFNLDYIFKKSIVWSSVTSTKFSVRHCEGGSLFDAGGSFAQSEDNHNYLLGMLNTKITEYYLGLLNPTLNFQKGNIETLPVIKLKLNSETRSIINENIIISKTDWDSFETSWDFERHPLINFRQSNALWGEPKENEIQEFRDNGSIMLSFKAWKDFANNNFAQLKSNEEELNRIFIEIYGLEDELTPEISDKDITIAKIFDAKEEIYDDIKGNRYILTKEDVIKSLISYAVGCIFGRYSLDLEGLAYAGGDWDSSKYTSFIPTKDNIILISDEEYFEDDIVNRFVQFVKVVYGEETLEENLKFIADALGGKGSPKEIIRNYFLKDFFNDHVKTYQKRPIYWQYDSGKQNGFKAFIYMHRYDEDTTGRVRINYLHKLQKAYERAIDNLKYDITNNKNPREVTQAEKRLTKLTKQLKECKYYDEKIAHLALARIAIDLDDGVKVNYEKVQTDEKGVSVPILGKI